MVKKTIILSFFALLSASAMPQKISLGSCIIKEDGIQGEYKGEMLNGKPHGKGNTVYMNGNVYEGEYVKGKRQGQGVYSFADGEK